MNKNKGVGLHTEQPTLSCIPLLTSCVEILVGPVNVVNTTFSQYERKHSDKDLVALFGHDQVTSQLYHGLSMVGCM